MEAFVIDPSRLVSDVVAYVAELRNTFQTQQQPINDDYTTLQKFCVKLETVLRHEQKERYSLLGYRKDYWNFITDCIPKDDGVRYVLAVPQMKSAQGKGRAFIRYALVHKTLADAVQRLLVNKSTLSSWYKQEAIFRNPSLSIALVNKLYDLNNIDFDLPCAGYDLDISWPAFSRRSFTEGQATGRRNSVSSMTSVDFRNERQDPLIELGTEISSLKLFFSGESPLAKSEGAFDNVSITASNVDHPPITELTLDISRIHQQALKWQAQMESERAKASHELKKAQDDRQFAIQESELKTKQLLEKYSLLSKAASEDSHAKCQDLKEKLSLAENILREREAELRELRNEISQSIVDSHSAQRAAIEFEKQLTSSERKMSELKSENDNLKFKFKSKEQFEKDSGAQLQEYKEKIIKLEAKESEYKERLSDANGNLKAKEVALVRVQESFEKLNGMVFGSFEELEAELKGRLMDREKGLESRSMENKKLEFNVVELQQQLRDLRGKLADSHVKTENLQSENNTTRAAYLELEETTKKAEKSLRDYEGLVAELEEALSESLQCVDKVDGADENSRDIEERSRSVARVVVSLGRKLADVTQELERTTQQLDEYQTAIQENDLQIDRLKSIISNSSTELETIRQAKEVLEKEKVMTDSRLVALETSEKSLQSELALVTEQNVQYNLELSRLRDENTILVALNENIEKDLSKLRHQIEEISDSKLVLEATMLSTTEKLHLLESDKTELEDRQMVLEEEIFSSLEEKAGLEDELLVAKQQLEAANEGRIRAEHAQVKVQAELENVRCMMDQEVAALKFTLSSETIKYETELKVLSEESQESARFKDRALEQDEVIAELEMKLKERGDAWLKEKRKYVNEIKHLRTEVQLCKNALDGNKQKLMSLENNLLLTSRQLEEERSRHQGVKKKVKEVEQQKNAGEKTYQDQIANMRAECRELKDRLIALTREKAELWKKADDMEHEIKVKASDRWVADEEVKNCTDCKAEFSFLLRKHHCRMCGRIFCHGCTSNWAKTPHSRKLKRVCKYCLANDKQIIPQHVKQRTDRDEVYDDTMSDISVDSRRSTSVLSISEDETRDSPNQSDGESPNSHEKRPTRADGVGTTTQRNTVINEPNAASSPVNEKKLMKEADEAKPEALEKQSSGPSNAYMSFSGVKSANDSAAEGTSGEVTSPVGEGFEVIDPREELGEVPESRVVVSDGDTKADMVVPAVNDKHGVSRSVRVPAGERYVLPVMVGTLGVTLCWLFSTTYKSMIFGIAYKQSEHTSDEDIETVLPLSRYSSNSTPVEGDWKVTSPGVYLIVFDNTFSRFTSKQLTCQVQLKRMPSILQTADPDT